MYLTATGRDFRVRKIGKLLRVLEAFDISEGITGRKREIGER